MNKTILSLLATILLSGSLVSQTKELTLQLTMRDGNSITGKSKLSNIVLLTDYGKLDIPVKNVNSLDLGIPSDKAVTEKVNSIIKQLSNSNEELRKSAYEELIKMNISAIPAITNVIYSAKYEMPEFSDYTADAALIELKAIHNVDDGFTEKDVVSIDYEYKMLGVYEFNNIDLKTEYGSLTIPKTKIKRIDILYAGDGESGEKVMKLIANKHISSNTNGGWLKTGIMVKAGQKISISATGEVVFASLSNSKYKPDGSISKGSTSEDYNYEGEYDYNSGSTYPAYGNVVFKIGEASNVIKAGAKYNGVAKSSGMLYISIYETVYNASNTGSYNVKLNVN